MRGVRQCKRRQHSRLPSSSLDVSYRRAVSYEWAKPTDEEKAKTPFTFQLVGGAPFCFAGLCSAWRPKGSPDDVEWTLTYTILTGKPNPLVAPVHDRMPVILPAEHFTTWLTEPDVDRAHALLEPFPAGQMEAFEVSRLVNSPRNDTPEILQDPKAPLKLRPKL